MSKTTVTKTQKPTLSLTNDQLAYKKQVSALLTAAGKAANTTLAKIKEAAAIALKELDGMPDLKTVREKSDFIAKVHADDLAKLGINERSLFKDSVVILLEPTAIVEIKLPTKKEAAVMGEAGAALPKMSKHAVRAAAKAIRTGEGTNRAQKPTAPKAKADLMAPSFIAAIPQIIADKKALAELKAALAAVGYDLKPVKVTASRKPASIAGMVSQINNAADVRAAA